jgi:hypothetical protein
LLEKNLFGNFSKNDKIIIYDKPQKKKVSSYIGFFNLYLFILLALFSLTKKHEEYMIASCLDCLYILYF